MVECHLTGENRKFCLLRFKVIGQYINYCLRSSSLFYYGRRPVFRQAASTVKGLHPKALIFTVNKGSLISSPAPAGLARGPKEIIKGQAIAGRRTGDSFVKSASTSWLRQISSPRRTVKYASFFDLCTPRIRSFLLCYQKSDYLRNHYSCSAGKFIQRILLIFDREYGRNL